jgi:tetratricopeptide (TPR) repeat protein
VLEKLDEAMEHLAPDAIQRRIGHLVVRSSVKRHLGQIGPAEEDLLQAEELATKSVQHETRVKVLVARSAHLQIVGRTKQAIISAEEAVDLASTLSGATAKEMQASAMLELASALEATSESTQARECANRADALLGVDYPGRLKWRALSLQGLIEWKLGAPEQGKTLLEAALALSLRQGWKRERATSINNLGAGYLEDGEYRQARQLLGEALTIRREIGDRRGEAAALGNLATTYSMDGKYDRARELYEESLAIKREIRDRRGEAISQLGLASLYARMGESEMARQIYQEAVAAFRQSGDRANEAKAMAMMGRLALSNRMWDEALEHIEKAYEMFVAIQHPTPRRQSARDLAGVRFDIAAQAVENGEEEKCRQQVAGAMELVSNAGASEILGLLVNRLVLPALRRSEDTASPLLNLVERTVRKQVFDEDEPVVDSLERALRYFAGGKSVSPLVDADPTQMVLITSLIDAVIRPQHLEARRLMEEGKLDEAQQVYEDILQRSPDDVEAIINRVSILVSKREYEAAEQRMQSASAIAAGSKHGILLRAEIEAGLGRVARAIDLLEKQISREPAEPLAYRQLAGLLRRERRFTELAQLLHSWREQEVEPAKHDAISVWIVEAHVLAGRIEIARTKLPDGTFLPESPKARLLLSFLRVLFSLLDQDGDRARRGAIGTLDEAANLAPDDLPRFVAEDLLERAKELLPEREYRFLVALSLAAQQQVDPMQFASEYLTKEEARTLVDRFSEESERARGALRKGELPGFEEIVRRSTQSIGPAAAIRALGEAWAELDDERKQRAVQVVLAALESSRDGDVAAALAVVGRRFPELGEDDRSGALEGVLALTRRSEAPQASRVRAVRLLNILYPNLAVPERDRVREALEPAREELVGPDLQEFFDQTVPAVESEDQP